MYFDTAPTTFYIERDVILWAVRWYVSYPIGYRQFEEIIEEHGVKVDHATLHRWVLKYVPLLEEEFQARKQPVGPGWRMDETCVRVRGTRKYISGGGQGRRHAGFPADCQAGSQSRVAVLAHGNQLERTCNSQAPRWQPVVSPNSHS
jgi:hypothetical protein